MPLKPLPQDLIADSDDTVCKYCGVSYLVLHTVEKLNQEVDSLKMKLKDQEVEYSQQLELKDQEIRRLLAELKQYKTKVDTAESTRSVDSSAIRELKNALNAVTRMNKTLETEKSDLQSELDLFRSSLEKKTKEFDEFKTTAREKIFSSLSGNISDRLKKYHLEVESIGFSIQKYLKTIDFTHINLKIAEALHQHICSCEEKDLELSKLSLSQSRIKDFQSDISRLSQQHEKDGAIIKQYSDQISELQSEITSHKQSMAESKTQEDLLRKDLIETQANTHQLISANSKLRDSISEHLTTISTLSDENEGLKGKVKAFQRDLTSLRSSSSSIGQMQTKIRLQLSESASTIRQLQKTLKEKEQEICSIRDSLEVSNKNVISLQSNLTESRSLCSSLSAGRTAAEAMVVKMKEEISKAHDSALQAQERESELLKRMGDLSLEKEEEEERIKKEIEMAVKRGIEEERKKWQEKLSSLSLQFQNDQATIVDAMKRKISDLEEKLRESEHLISEQSNNLRNITSQKMELEKNLQQERDLISRLKAEKEEKKELLTEGKVDAPKEKEEFSKLLSKISELEALRDKDCAKIRVMEETIREECKERTHLLMLVKRMQRGAMMQQQKEQLSQQPKESVHSSSASTSSSSSSSSSSSAYYRMKQRGRGRISKRTYSEHK
ncbi:hypothetical protein ADUPG1_012340 [Aduncisulcus paluster]|uniref:Uncharacterized protein n=1 Tax=Aduncisulcus paluster TaxID=2918883 RepID=A0ABQ5JZ52_9EUKA|nr:hypothetical protein ADUPG1_012340 [Aduncisulcus paluster]